MDYTREDFAAGAPGWDVILDQVGNRPLSELARLLRPGGRYVMVGGPSGRWVDPMPRALAAEVRSRLGGPEMRMMLAEIDPADLAALAELARAGKLRPALDRSYPLAQAAEALRYLEAGHARGKVVVEVAAAP